MSIETKQKSSKIEMCSGPLFSKILFFAIPLMLSSILQLLFNAADIVVVGRYAGSESLAAVGSTSSLINLITNLFVGLSVGTNVVVAHFFGSKENTKIGKTVHTSVVLSLISGVMLTVIGVVMAPIFLELMSTPEDIISLSTLYLRIYFIGMPAVMLYNFGSAILRAAGDTKRPLYYLLFAGLINVILNLIFVIGFGMGVDGVAIATVISQIISAVLIIWCLTKEEGCLHLELRELKLDREIVIRILKIGLPAGFQGVVFSLSNVVIQSSINSFGSVIMAGSAAAANIEGFVYVAMNAFHQTALTFTGQNYGAGEYKRVNRILFICQGMVVVTGMVLGNLAVIFGTQLLSIYSPDMLVIAAGLRRMNYVCRVYALCGIMDVMVGALRGIGYSVMPMVVSLLGACGLRLIWIVTIFKLYHTEAILYMSYPVSWIITFSVHIICYIIVTRKFRHSKKIMVIKHEI